MVDFIEFPDVVQEVRGALHPGKLKMQPGAVSYRNNKTSKTMTFSASTIEKTEWLQRAKGFCLKIVLADGTIHRIDGFKESEYDKLQSFMHKNYGLSCPKVDLNVKGWNWGQANFVGDTLSFDNHDKTLFEIPLTNVSNSVMGKNEVTLEFHQNDEAAVSLCEMRFHIPTGNVNVTVEDDENKEPIDLVQEFHQNVLEKADIMRALGDSIAVFQEIQCLTPRGRYDIKVFPTFIQLHGRSFDFKIPYSTVLRLFLLPHRDGRQMYFVLSLDPPMKQGQTRYPFLILLFNMDDETTIELGLEEEEIEEKYKDKLTKEMSGTEYEVIGQIITAITNRKITTPVTFKSHDGTSCVQCSYKAQTGSLYPLEKGFVFIPKPALHLRFEEVSQINFARSTGNTRSFDFDIETKTGTTYNFVGVEKNEYGKLYDFVSNKNLRVKNIGGKPGKRGFTSTYKENSSDEEGHDAYLERMKHEGKDRDDDEDSSEDEDFNPDLEEGVDVREEYDSNPETTSESEGEESEMSGTEEEKVEKRKVKKELKEAEKERKREAKEKRKERKDRPPTEKRTKKSKKNTDPNCPKRPQTSYFLWMNENRDAMKEERPDASLVEFSKMAGERWRAMTAEDKAPYEEKSKVAKAKYEVDMIEYRKTAPPPSNSPIAKKTKGGGAAAKTKSPQKASSTAFGGDKFKSAEFIEDSDSDSDKETKKKEKKEGKSKKEKSKVEKSKGSDDNKSDENKSDENKSDADESDVGE